ncbi:MAG: ECF RNA polymerase sigma factor SigH [Bacteroidetes bacterium ADurb.Bin234]|nr:MAG: ECF RNA polymerase sigma factor SigH [Bacteroidetes bacterium ADurb.Bin234]
MIKDVKENIECCDLNQIVFDFYKPLKRYLIGKTKYKETAEDIVQEVMLKVISAHQKNLQVKNLKAWLYQIARNTLIDYYRNFKNQIYENVDTVDEMFFYTEDETYNSDDFLIPMINLLPQKYSKPLFLSDIENLPQSEIAEQLHLSLSATKMRIQRARKMLYELFIECCDIEYTKTGAFLNCKIKENCSQLKNSK